MLIEQINRSIAISTPLEDDVLVLRRMFGHEAISQLFQYELELYSDDLEIKYEKLLGGNATVRVAVKNEKIRYFNGYISSFSFVGEEGRHFKYHAILSPWLWFLTRTADCRIFQEKTVPDIIKEVFRHNGFTDFRDELTTEYKEWEYIVQYRETDFNFVSRLMEQEGIYYFFTHKDGKHELVLADAFSSHQSTEEYHEIPYFPPENSSQRNQDHIDTWLIQKKVMPGSCVLNDFNFKAPKNVLINISNDEKDHQSAHFEMYDYPGKYRENTDGEQYARKRIEELQAQYETVSGAGNVRGLTTGASFNLVAYPREDQNREYLLLSAEYEINSDPLEGGGTEVEESFYCSFSAVDFNQQYRAPRITPKPVIQGTQTAVVVGPSGEEIYTDNHGRVKLQYHWDRYGESNENSSCWTRVSQVHAGKGFGGVDIPRIGEEVIVSFEEGDPDRPMVIGRVYNEDNKPPNGLPDTKMVSGLQSNSTPGGGGNNMIMLDDTKDKEGLNMHAQYNMDTTVENDQSNTINNNRTTVIAVDDAETIGSNQKIDIGSEQIVVVGANRNLDVGADQTTTVGSNLKMTVGSNEDISIGSNQKLSIGSKQTNEIASSRTTSIGAADTLTVDGKQSISVTGPIEIASNAKITLSVAGSSIEISPAGIVLQSSGLITVKGSIIKLN